HRTREKVGGNERAVNRGAGSGLVPTVDDQEPAGADAGVERPGPARAAGLGDADAERAVVDLENAELALAGVGALGDHEINRGRGLRRVDLVAPLLDDLRPLTLQVNLAVECRDHGAGRGVIRDLDPVEGHGFDGPESLHYGAAVVGPAYACGEQ